MTKYIYTLIIFTVMLTASIYASDKAAIDKEAPNFKLTDTNGNEHSLSDYRGKFVVLEWNNFDCPFVKKHYNGNNMQSLQKKYTGEDVVWLTINSSAPGKQGHYSPADLNSRIKENNAFMTAYLLDESGDVGKMYGAKTTPHMYVVDADGILIYAGGIDDIASTKIEDLEKANNYVEAALDAAISGKEVTIKTSKPYGCSVKY